MDFARTQRRKMRALNLTPLIDVLFILVVFFMLTMSFMRIESMELILPSESAKTQDKPQEVVRLFIHADGNIVLGQRRMGQQELGETLSRMLDAQPDMRIMLLTADGVDMQLLVNVMDRIYLLGGKSLLVRKWTDGKRGG